MSMLHRIRGAKAPVALLGAVLSATVALSACGSSGSTDASSLLRQTFSGSHAVNSGNLSFSLTVKPSGSSTLSGPISLSFGGPFQSQGKGKLPKSNFTVQVSALGHTGSLAILSTGSAGYVTLQGTSYQLPPATFQRLESSFAQLASTPGSSGGSGALSRLGINPLRWLVNPSVVGSENVGGADTTHIRAGVNVAALLTDLNTFLQKAATLGVSKTTTSISDSTRQRIAAAVHNPTFDVWTGNDDKTIRRLALNLDVPVTGTLSQQLGGLNHAAIGLSMQYADLNQPQTINAPASTRPFSEFSVKIQTLLQAIRGAVGGNSGTGNNGTGNNGTSTTGNTGNLQRYTQCVQAAGNDVTKIQQCAPLLNGG